MVNAARAVGPAIAGILIVTVGVGWCFVLNSLSFAAVVGSLLAMNTALLTPSRPTERARGQLVEGFKYVARNAELGVPLLMMALIGMLTYEFTVTLPLMAKDVFNGGAETFGIMTSTLGIGAIAGGLITATRGRTGMPSLVQASALFGVFMVATALAPVLWVEIIALALVGYASVSLLATGNTTLQLATNPQMRGRVMALWAVAFLGTTPIGGPLIGWIISMSNPRVGMLVGAAACFAAVAIGLVALRRHPHVAESSDVVRNPIAVTGSARMTTGE
jgi:MFS family permease